MPMPIMQGPGRPPIFVGGPIPRQYRGRGGQSVSARSGPVGSAIAAGMTTLVILILLELFGYRIIFRLGYDALIAIGGSAIFHDLLNIIPLASGALAGLIATLRTRRLRFSLLTGSVIGVGAALFLIIYPLIRGIGVNDTIAFAVESMVALTAATFAGGLLAAVINLLRR